MPNLVFDIGANNGHDAERYLKLGYKVVAVEANPALCADMRSRFETEITSGQLVIVEKAISHRRKVTLYINSADDGWGTTMPDYATRGAKLRGSVITVEVDTTTIVDLVRAHGVPDRMKIDIEGADILCLMDLYGGDLPSHLSIERPKYFVDQMLALTLMRRMGYGRFAFVDQTEESGEVHATTGLCADEIPSGAWQSGLLASVNNIWLYGVWALGGVARLVPVVRSIAPRHRWFDIHAMA